MLSEQSKLLLSDFLDSETTQMLEKRNIYTTEELLVKPQMPVHEDKIYVFGTALRNRLLMRKQHSNQEFINNTTFLEVSQLSDLFNANDTEHDLVKEIEVIPVVVEQKTSMPPHVELAPKEEDTSFVGDGVFEELHEIEEDIAEKAEQFVEPLPHLSNGAPILPIAYHPRRQVNVFLSDFSPAINVMSTEELRRKVAVYFEKL